MRFSALLIKNLLRRKMRTALTCLGIALAIGAMVTLLGIAHGFEQASINSFTQHGIDLVVVADGVIDQLNSDIDEGVGPRIHDEIPGIRTVTPGLLEMIEMPRGNSTIGVLIQGWPHDSFIWNNLKIMDGRRWHPDEQRVAVLGTTLAQNLKKGVGDTLEIQGETFHVIGIYESHSVYENGGLAVPLRELQYLMRREGRVTGFSIILQPDADVAEVRRRIRELRDEHGRPLRLAAIPTQEYASSSVQIQLARGMAWLTSVVAVFIGAVGMLNTMTMSVFERIREIGVLRAVGWRKSRVARMVLGEALLLSLAGATLGTLGALVVVRALTSVPLVSGFIEGTIAPVVLAEGFAAAIVLGLAGGLYPAYRAARMLPTEAIRHE